MELLKCSHLYKNYGDKEVLKDIALNSFEISYKHKKKQGFIF